MSDRWKDRDAEPMKETKHEEEETLRALGLPVLLGPPRHQNPKFTSKNR